MTGKRSFPPQAKARPQASEIRYVSPEFPAEEGFRRLPHY